jgi:LPXTG-site transpeptidase (sortase) family protein
MAHQMPARAATFLARVAAGACLAAVLVSCGGGAATRRTPTPAEGASPTASVTTEALASETPPAASTPIPTLATSARAGEPITFSSGQHVLPSDLAARGVGQPGRGLFTGKHLVIPSIGVDAPMAAVTVGAEAKMPSPPSLTEVAWYDFSAWPGLGGSPGSGGNVVLAGDAIRPGIGSGVFTYLGRVKVGDYVKMLLNDGGTLCYRIEFNKLAVNTEVDFGEVVQATAEESVTLITGQNEASRVVAWGRRASCAAEPAPTPTPIPRSGHYALKIVAEHYRFTVVGGDTIPMGVFSVDITLELRDTGVKHGIAFLNPGGYPVVDITPVEGPTTASTNFLVGLPELAGVYTFHCPVHPQMTGSIMVEAP